MQQTVTDVACTVCGCVCDDLQVDIANGCVTQARGTCPLSEPWFASLRKPSERPLALVEGKPTNLEDAIQRAADILRASKAPLIWGLSRGSTAGHRAAVALGERIGGTVDTVTSAKPQAAIALQKLGQSTCTLGEVRNRADLVIFWRANPMVTHPRHLERYSAEPRGLFVPQGRADRTVVVIDSAATETSRRADEFLQLPPEADSVVIETLRKVVRGEEPSETGLSVTLLLRLQQLAARMKECQYGALFLESTKEDVGSTFDMAEALFTLTRELNAFTRFTAHVLGPPSGAENALTWQTGFPFAVNFATGYPRFDSQKFGANGLIARGEVDSCLLVGSDCVGQLSPEARERLQSIPTIALDYPNMEPCLAATVQFTTAIYGIHAVGTTYRMDGVSIPLRKILTSDYPTEDEVLSAISARLGS